MRAVWRSSSSSSAASRRQAAAASRSAKASAAARQIVGGDGAHALEHAPGGGRELGGQAGAGPLGDVLGEVAGALELGDDPDEGQRVAELAGHRRLQEQQPLDVGLELDHQVVDGRPRRPATLARASVSSPSSASLAAATASHTSANRRMTFWSMSSSSRW